MMTTVEIELDKVSMARSSESYVFRSNEGNVKAVEIGLTMGEMIISIAVEVGIYVAITIVKASNISS